MPQDSNSIKNKENTKPTPKQVIEITKKAFAPPTARQLEQQAQAVARGGLTSRGISKFKSLSSEKQKEAVEKARTEITGRKTDPTKILDPSKLMRDFQEAKRIDRQKRGILPRKSYLELGGRFQRVSPGDISTRFKDTFRLVETKTPQKKVKNQKVQLPTKKQKIQTSTLTSAPRRTLIKKIKSSFEESEISKYIKSKTGQKLTKKEIQEITSDKIIGGVGRGVTDAVGGVVNLVKIASSPRKTFETVTKFISAPKKIPGKVKTYTVSEGKRFLNDPVAVTIEYALFSKLANKAGIVAKRTPVGRFVQEELFILKHPSQLRKYARATIKGSKVQEKINPTKVKSLKSVDLFEVKTLNPIEGNALKRTLQKTDSVVFGSVASRTISKKRTPIPKDVDIATKNINTFAKKFLDELPQKAKSDYILKGEKLIRKIDGVALFDLKPLERLYPNKQLFRKKGFLPVIGTVKALKLQEGSIIPKVSDKARMASLEIPTQKLIKVEGIKLTGFGEQTTRKGLGTLQVLAERNAKRSKDPSALIASLEIQKEYLKSTKSLNPMNKYKIKQLEDSLKILKSKDFERILNEKVPGLTKEYPILSKLDTKKLSEVKKIKLNDLQIKKNKIINKKTGQVLLDVSYLPKSVRSVLPSIIPKSRLVPSKIPSSKVPVSKIPSSKVPASKIPSSKTPPSKIPSSKVPVSKIPSSKVPVSKIPSSKMPPSKIPASKIPPSKVPVSKIPSRKIVTRFPPIKITRPQLEAINKKVKKLKKKKTKVLYSYTPTLAGIGEKAQKVQGKFTGFETRGNVIIIKTKPIKVKRHKRATLKNKAFVRRHRRNKPRSKK